jgi:parallel beta-helix repeat protein
MTAYINGNPNGTITNIVGTTVTLSFGYLGSTATGVDFVGSSVTPLAGCQISGMHIYRNSAATGGVGVLFQDTAVAKISDVQVTNFGVGIYLRGATNTQLSRVLSANVDGSFSFVGFQLDGTFPVTGSGFGMSAGNFSSVFYDCWVEGRGNTSTDSKGFYILGKVIQDYQFYGANTQGTDYGVVIDGTNVTGTYYPWGDIIFVGAIIDGYSLAGVSMTNILDTRAVNFVGGWFNCSAAPSTNVFDFSLTNCRNVTISDIQMQSGDNWGTAYSVYADTCQQIKVLNCTITDKYYGLVLEDSEYCIVSNNSFYRSSSKLVNALRHITLDNSVRCALTSNSHDGGCDVAVEVKSNCTSIPITACVFNAGTITTRISDPGTKASLSNNVGT